MNRPLGLALALLTALWSTVCASITTDSLQMVSLTSDPSDAVCIIKGPKGFTTRITTPNGFAVSRGEGDLSIVCNKGDQVGSALIKEQEAGWTSGNILFGGLVGLAVDAGTGKMWKYPSAGNVVMLDKDKQPKEPQIIEGHKVNKDDTEEKKKALATQ